MKIFLFGKETSFAKLGSSAAQIHEVITRVAATTDTTDLVVTCYIQENRKAWRGVAECRGWVTPQKFLPSKGHWAFTQKYGTPEDLPEQFKLIRITLGDKLTYPRTQQDAYGFVCTYAHFHDDLAELFGHELHHFRTGHLNLHGKQRGEISANKWALARAQELGFGLTATRVQKAARKKKTQSPINIPQNNPGLLNKLISALPYLSDTDLGRLLYAGRKQQHLLGQAKEKTKLQLQDEKIRALKPGTPLTVIHRGDRAMPYGTTVYLEEILRKGSKRVGVKTPSGQSWRVPMAWVEPACPSPKPDTVQKQEKWLE